MIFFSLISVLESNETEIVRLRNFKTLGCGSNRIIFVINIVGFLQSFNFYKVYFLYLLLHIFPLTFTCLQTSKGNFKSVLTLQAKLHSSPTFCSSIRFLFIVRQVH